MSDLVVTVSLTAKADHKVSELSLCIVHCNVCCCIIMLHNSTSSCNRSADMIVSISLCLALSLSASVTVYICGTRHIYFLLLLSLTLISEPIS